MSEPTPDTAFTLAEALLGRIMDRLTDLGCPPLLAFVFSGVAVPAADCCQGMAWVRVGTIQPTDGSYDAYTKMANLPATAQGATIALEAGLLRCAKGIDGDGEAPRPSEYQEEALRAAVDRDAVRRAILCDFPADILAANADGHVPGPWVAIDVGECTGGAMTTTVGTTLVF